MLGGHTSQRLLLSGIYFSRAVVFALFLIVPTTPFVVLAFAAAMGLLWLSTVPLTSGLVAVMFGTRHVGMLFGVVFLSHQVGAFIGVWLGGAVYEATGAYEAMWWLSIALALAAAVVHLPIHERRAPALGAGPRMSRRLRRELGAGLAVAAIALAGAYWQAERTGAFESRSRGRRDAAARLPAALASRAKVRRVDRRRSFSWQTSPVGRSRTPSGRREKPPSRVGSSGSPPQASRSSSPASHAREGAAGARARPARDAKPMESSRRHVLVVANRTAATPALLDAVKRYAREQPTTFALLIPDAPGSDSTDWTFELALPLLERAARGPVDGLTATSGDPFDAVRRVLADGSYDQVIISTLPRRVSKWLRRDLPNRVESLGVPVEVGHRGGTRRRAPPVVRRGEGGAAAGRHG